MWIVIISLGATLVVTVAAFLMGIYFIFRNIGKKVSDIPKQIIKETFVIIKDKIKK